MSKCTNEMIDALDKEEIQQLHKAVTGFASQSFELKKLCVTVEISACALTTTIFQDNFGDSFLIALKIIILLIPIFFYIVDITTYYYQDKLRYSMFIIENKIRMRHKIKLKNNNRFSPKQSKIMNRILRSIINISNIIYWVLIISGFIFFYIVK